GRDFTKQDGLPQPAPPPPGTAQTGTPPPRLPTMAILSYDYFQRRFGGDVAVIGRSMRTEGPFSPLIVGVLAPHFRLYFPPEAETATDPQIWIANRLNYDHASRNSVSIHAVARLTGGASRWQLARQMLTESLLLAALGALGGLALAWAGIHELLALAPPNLPRMDTIRIDAPVLAFTALAALAAAAIFGLISAWRASRLDLIGALGGSSRNEGLNSGGLLRKMVVVVEVALCFVLLVGSGLMF